MCESLVVPEFPRTTGNDKLFYLQRLLSAINKDGAFVSDSWTAINSLMQNDDCKWCSVNETVIAIDIELWEDRLMNVFS